MLSWSGFSLMLKAAKRLEPSALTPVLTHCHSEQVMMIRKMTVEVESLRIRSTVTPVLTHCHPDQVMMIRKMTVRVQSRPVAHSHSYEGPGTFNLPKIQILGVISCAIIVGQALPTTELVLECEALRSGRTQGIVCWQVCVALCSRVLDKANNGNILLNWFSMMGGCAESESHEWSELALFWSQGRSRSISMCSGSWSLRRQFTQKTEMQSTMAAC
eukprot:3854794-Amphidinium_carterae.1